MVQIELARRANLAKVVASFEFRALAPVYAGAVFTVQARRESDGGITTCIADRNGGLGQQGRGTFQGRTPFIAGDAAAWQPCPAARCSAWASPQAPWRWPRHVSPS